MKTYEIIVGPDAQKTILGIVSEDDMKRIGRRLEALRIAPDMGIIYEPIYKAMKPREKLRVTYAGNYGIYYTLDVDKRHVNIEAIEDQRRDPNGRFQ